MKRLLVLAVVCSITSVASAAIVAVDTGTGAPPGTLGPYSISALPFDTTAVYSDVTSAPGNPPLTGDVGFSIPCSLRHIGMGWMTWSHGYTGVVYFTNYSTSVRLDIPDDTAAFLTYVEPNPFSWQSITATAQDGTSLTLQVHGSSGANGFGFYGTDGDEIVTVTISSGTDFAFGELYGALIPEPGSLSLLGLAGLFVLRRR